MKANAPERLYLSKTIYSTYLYQVPDPDDETAVEYTRTDAFIEKAKSWLHTMMQTHAVVELLTGKHYEQELINDFENYMRGE